MRQSVFTLKSVVSGLVVVLSLIYPSLLISSFTQATEPRPLLRIEYEDVLFSVGPQFTSTWEPGTVSARSRWTFELRSSDSEPMPIDVNICTDIDIDLSEWHKPRTVEAQPPNYHWRFSNGIPELTFLMRPLVQIDPGIRVTRNVTPNPIPPGVSIIWVDVSLTFLKAAIVEGQTMTNRGGWFAVQIPAEWMPELEVIEYLTEQGRGIPISFPGVSYKLRVGIKVRNNTSSNVLLNPSVDINLDERPLLWEPTVRLQLLRASQLQFWLQGIVREHLNVAFSTPKPVNWDYTWGIGHGQLWLWWDGHLQEESG